MTPAQDPTHGLVNYLSARDASKQKLAYVAKNGNVIMAVDAKTNLASGKKRNSVRITSKAPFVKGQLLLLDAVHMPTGCATWPAFWTVGPCVRARILTMKIRS